MRKKILTAISSIVLAASIGLSGLSVWAAPKRMSDGGVFDPEYYAQTYPDVKAAVGTDENALYAHYVNNGKAEGRQPYAPGTDVSKIAAAPASTVRVMSDGGIFDPVYYANTYPDVKAAFGTDAEALYKHYTTSGKKEGRQPYAPGTDVSSVQKSGNTSTSSSTATTSTTTKSSKRSTKYLLPGTYRGYSLGYYMSSFTVYYNTADEAYIEGITYLRMDDAGSVYAMLVDDDYVRIEVLSSTHFELDIWDLNTYDIYTYDFYYAY